VEELESRIRNINSMASLSKTTYSNVSVDYVLGIGGFDVNRVDEQVESTVRVFLLIVSCS